jgi:hypothetical protein
MYNLVQTGHLPKKKRSGYAREYLKKRLNRIDEILHRKEVAITTVDVHELRLEIKKLKSLFTLLRKGNGSFPARRYYKPFKTIFEKAGEIRIIHVEQELLKQYITDSSDRYLDQLQKLTHEKSERLRKMVNSDAIAKLRSNKKEITPFLNQVTEKRVRHFLKTNAGKLHQLLKRGIFKDEDLHVIRKKLKSFYFIAKMTYKTITIPEPWNKLLELLGKWHDDKVAIEHLRKAIYSSRYSQDEVNRLYMVKREITENRENLFDQIVGTYFLIENKEGTVSVPDNFMINQIQ